MSIKKEEEYETFEEAVMESALVGIVGYAALLTSTLIASGIFGLPKFMFTPLPWDIEKKCEKCPKFIFVLMKIPFFFLFALGGTFGYIWLQISNLLDFASKYLKDNETKFPVISDNNMWMFDSAKNLLSMTVFVCWFILMYRSIIQYNTVTDIVNDEEIKNTVSHPTSFKLPDSINNEDTNNKEDE